MFLRLARVNGERKGSSFTSALWSITANEYTMVIHFMVDGYLGYFPLLAIVNNAATNFLIHVSCSTCIKMSLKCVCLGMALLGLAQHSRVRLSN